MIGLAHTRVTSDESTWELCLEITSNHFYSTTKEFISYLRFTLTRVTSDKSVSTNVIAVIIAGDVPAGRPR